MDDQTLLLQQETELQAMEARGATPDALDKQRAVILQTKNRIQAALLLQSVTPLSGGGGKSGSIFRP